MLAILFGLLSFLLGMYVSATMDRWNTLRNNCIGKLWGTIENLCILSGAIWSRGTYEDKASRHLVLRYGLASHALFFKQARGDDLSAGLQEMVEQNVLTDEERKVLEKLPAPSQVVISWLTTFFFRAISEAPAGRTPVPHAREMLPYILEKCCGMRDGVGHGMAIVNCQQPFNYVQLMSFITNTVLLLNAVYTGCMLGVYQNDQGHSWSHHGSGFLYFVAMLLRVVFVTIVYSGLLDVSANVHLSHHSRPASAHVRDCASHYMY
jgi:hypothetical protein